MRLVCDSCGSRFRIADDLVRGRDVKVRCRNCGAAVELPPVPARRESRRPPPALPAGKEEWYLAAGEVDVGPLSLEELRLRVQREELGADDLVWRDGFASWEPVGRVSEVRVALGLPRPRRRTLPPALPPRDPTSPGDASRPGPPPRLTVIHGGHGTALAAQPQPAPEPPPVARSTPAAGQRLARWPVVLLVVGAVGLAVAALVVLLCRDEPRDPLPRSRAIQVHFPPPARVAPVEPRADDPIMVDPLSIEVRIPREVERPRSRARQPDAGRPDAGRHFEVQLVTRILRRNRSSLVACDQLAERRGESLEGTRALFGVRVDEQGEATVTVSGREMSDALLGCYRSMVRQWEIPRIGQAYTARFFHVHRAR